MMIVMLPSTPLMTMGILTMMNPPTQGTNLADLAMKAASAAATNHSAWFPKSSLLYLQVRNCIFVKICIFVLCMISLQLIFSKFLLNYWEVLLFHRWWYLLQQLCLHLSVWLFLCLVGTFEVALYRTNLLSSLVRWLITPIHGHWNYF